jgi:hypothetical protein
MPSKLIIANGAPNLTDWIGYLSSQSFLVRQGYPNALITDPRSFNDVSTFGHQMKFKPFAQYYTGRGASSLVVSPDSSWACIDCQQYSQPLYVSFTPADLTSWVAPTFQIAANQSYDSLRQQIITNDKLIATRGSSPFIYIYNKSDLQADLGVAPKSFSKLASAGVTHPYCTAISPDDKYLYVGADPTMLLRFDLTDLTADPVVLDGTQTPYIAAVLGDPTDDDNWYLLVMYSSSSPAWALYDKDLSSTPIWTSTSWTALGISPNSNMVDVRANRLVPGHVVLSQAYSRGMNAKNIVDVFVDASGASPVPKYNAIWTNTYPPDWLDDTKTYTWSAMAGAPCFDLINKTIIAPTEQAYSNGSSSIHGPDARYSVFQPNDDGTYTWLPGGAGFEVARMTANFDPYYFPCCLVQYGLYKITGTVRDKNNAPAARTIIAFDRETNTPMAKTTSDATTGDYRLILPDAGPYDVQFMALDGENLNDLFFARTIPEPIELSEL